MTATEDRLRQTVTHLRARVSALTTQAATLAAQLSAQTAQVSTLAAQLAATVQDRDTQVAALTAQVGDLQAQINALENPPPPPVAPLLAGARANDLSFADVAGDVGPLRVTRLFHEKLPTTYTREGIPAGVRLIISFKDGTNLAAYAASIPAGEDVELCFHHEPEGDFGGDGATFVEQFTHWQGVAKAANPAVPFAFIAGGYQYGATSRHGYDGSFIPPAADRNYLDSYQRGDTHPLTTVDHDPSVLRYRQLLTDRGLTFDGFTEYGRGVVPKGGTPDPAMLTARPLIIAADADTLTEWGVRVWAYWWTTDLASGDQWRPLDGASRAAWRAVTARFAS